MDPCNPTSAIVLVSSCSKQENNHSMVPVSDSGTAVMVLFNCWQKRTIVLWFYVAPSSRRTIVVFFAGWQQENDRSLVPFDPTNRRTIVVFFTGWQQESDRSLVLCGSTCSIVAKALENL